MDPTLLLADDSVTVQRVIELTFADEHVRVVTVADGEQAIKRIDADHPDIVLADVGMPKVDGYGVASHVKQSPELRHIPVLLLSGAFDPIDEKKARASGCDGVLVKPFEPQALVGRVRELLAGRKPAALWPADLPRGDAAPTAPPAPATLAPRDTPPVPVRTVLQPGGPTPAPVRAAPPREAPVAAPPPPVDSEFELGLDELDEAFARQGPAGRPADIDDRVVSEFAQDLHELRESSQPGPGHEPRPHDWDAPRHEAEPDRHAGHAAPDHEWIMGPREVPRRETSPALPPHAPADLAAIPHEDEAVAPPSFGDWDLPARPVASEPAEESLEPRQFSEFVEPTRPVEPVRPTEAARPVEAARPIEAARPVEPARPIEPAPEPRRPATPVLVPAPAQKRVELPPDGGKVSMATAFSALLAAEQKQPAYRPTVSTPALSDAVIEEVVRRVLARMTDEVVQRVVLDSAERLVREEIERIKAHPE